jgi:hypothetical protein
MMVLAVVACIGASGCGDNDNEASPPPSAELQCEVVGTLCHDSETEEGQVCHELGHDGPPNECAAQFSSCIGLCLDGDDGDPFCHALGSLCHDVQTAEGQACHDLGHDGDAATCRRRFDGCAAHCLEAGEG